MDQGRHGLGVRGDSLYCPLAFSLDPYWFCEPDCPHCYLRGLNHVWGTDLRPIDLNALEKRLVNGLSNKQPKTPLAHCLANKKTIRLGNKVDPFQPCELEYLRTQRAITILIKLDWSVVIQTRFLDNLINVSGPDISSIRGKKLITVMPVISPGLDRDVETFENGTPDIQSRIKIIKTLIREKVSVGVNGEPFIPGFHTIRDFEETLKLLKSAGVKSYNTYNFHFTPFVAKRIVNLPGVDIELIWEENQDRRWKKTLAQLISIAKKHNMALGCPDFVNSGPGYREPANTCCGITVENPTTFNTHHWKMRAQQGFPIATIADTTYDGSGDYEQGAAIIRGDKSDFFTLRDAGVLK